MFIRNHPIYHSLTLFLGLLVLFSGLSRCGKVHAANMSWAENMFETKTYDFGSVPLLSETEYRFTFTNDQWDEVRIVSASSSCSCTDASYTKDVIKRGETGEIIAKVNTSGQHKGNKGATIRVLFDKPTNALVQLVVSVYIRPDVVLNPGRVDFGAISEGKAATKVVRLQYAGRPGWEIQRIDRANNNMNVKAVANPIKANDNTGEVTYDITVTLSEKTPPGYVHEILRLVTTDSGKQGQRGASTIELPVTGMVMDSLVAKPSPFQFGFVSSGETVTKYLVLSSSQPFRIKSVNCPKDRRFKFFPSDQLRSIHVVGVSFSSKSDRAEKIASTIFIRTDLPNQELVKIDVHAKVLSSEEANYNEYYAPQWRDKLMGMVESKVRTPRRVPLPQTGQPISKSEVLESEENESEEELESPRVAMNPARTRTDYALGHKDGNTTPPPLPLKNDGPLEEPAPQEEAPLSAEPLEIPELEVPSASLEPRKMERPEWSVDVDDAKRWQSVPLHKEKEKELEAIGEKIFVAPPKPQGALREFAVSPQSGWESADSLSKNDTTGTGEEPRLSRVTPIRSKPHSVNSPKSPSVTPKSQPEVKFGQPRITPNTTRAAVPEKTPLLQEALLQETLQAKTDSPSKAVQVHAVEVRSFAPKPKSAPEPKFTPQNAPQSEAADEPPVLARNVKPTTSPRPPLYVSRSNAAPIPNATGSRNQNQKLPNVKNLSSLVE